MTTPYRCILLLAMLVLPLGWGKRLPPAVKALYQSIRTQERCQNVYATGFHSAEGDGGDFEYCADHLASNNILYIRGTSHALANMDIDCDGDQQATTPDDNPCASSTDTQSQTSFSDTIKSFDAGISDLNPHVHPYVVFGNDGTRPDWPVYRPQSHHVQPLSVMAVVCNKKLIYGIWGDINGDDGQQPMIGEASISLATACFGPSMTGNNGHEENDILYLAFPGAEAVVGPDAAWNASSYRDFARSIEPIGDALVKRRIGDTSKAIKGARPRLLVLALIVGVLMLAFPAPPPNFCYSR
ncbi:hypothetical protein L249_5000 [Ophiocordyceps polyrhachis-furcata BCC 54312]|uniref:Endo-chitosanase n=1 Tax=Ophiocordyceps polyrhachis-furcata BCC 54312 TaxID=1330021 RepID=A0A367L380_9HYPO|nr:hypothetical protein L249_5000 [Ophiocordyceps polyrhachis-furcata BCC 54312]